MTERKPEFQPEPNPGDNQWEAGQTVTVLLLGRQARLAAAAGVLLRPAMEPKAPIFEGITSKSRPKSVGPQIKRTARVVARRPHSAISVCTYLSGSRSWIVQLLVPLVLSGMITAASGLYRRSIRDTSHTALRRVCRLFSNQTDDRPRSGGSGPAVLGKVPLGMLSMHTSARSGVLSLVSAGQLQDQLCRCVHATTTGHQSLCPVQLFG